MSCLVDAFVITSKYKWMHIINYPTEKDFHTILKAVPEKYRMMLRALMVKFKSMDLIMDNRNPENAMKIMKAAEPYQIEDIRFHDRYRGKCLQQILRITFYDTLLIVENDYNEAKYNYFICLKSNHVISQSHWASCMSEDQSFVQQTFRCLEKSGSNVHALHG